MWVRQRQKFPGVILIARDSSLVAASIHFCNQCVDSGYWMPVGLVTFLGSAKVGEGRSREGGLWLRHPTFFFFAMNVLRLVIIFKSVQMLSINYKMKKNCLKLSLLGMHTPFRCGWLVAAYEAVTSISTSPKKELDAVRWLLLGFSRLNGSFFSLNFSTLYLRTTHPHKCSNLS